MFCIHAKETFSQNYFSIDGLNYKIDTKIHTYQYRFNIRSDSSIFVDYPSEMIKYVNRAKNVFKEVKYRKVNNKQIELFTSVSFKNTFNQDSLILETANDTTILELRNFNYDSRNRIIKITNYYQDPRNHQYTTQIDRTEYIDTLINDTLITYERCFEGNELLPAIVRKVMYDSIGRVQFIQLILPFYETTKCVTEFLYNSMDSVIEKRNFVNGELVYSSIIDTLKYVPVCSEEYFENIPLFQDQSELEINLIELLTKFKGVLRKPDNCEEKHILFSSSDLRRKVVVEWGGPDFSEKS